MSPASCLALHITAGVHWCVLSTRLAGNLPQVFILVICFTGCSCPNAGEFSKLKIHADFTYPCSQLPRRHKRLGCKQVSTAISVRQNFLTYFPACWKQSLQRRRESLFTDNAWWFWPSKWKAAELLSHSGNRLAVLILPSGCCSL